VRLMECSVRTFLLVLLLLSCQGASSSVRAPVQPVRAETPLFNQRVLALLATYPERGAGGYQWPAPKGYAGTTQDLFLDGERIARGGQGSHCVGITFEVFFLVLEQWPGGFAASGFTEEKAKQLLKLWFVPTLGGKGVAEALPAVGLGREVPWREAIEGDFFQVWMNDKTGHSAIFLSWVFDEGGEIKGVRYWSSQPWTEGIGIAEHLIGSGSNEIDPNQFYVVRSSPMSK
jgi:hypothetical protein